MNYIILTIILIFLFIKHWLLSQKFEKQKNYFTQTLKHDLRTSTLAQIRGIELLKKTHCMDKTCQTLTSEIDDSCRYTLDMISVLLNIIEFNSGKNVLNYNYFNIAELLTEISTGTVLKPRDKNIDIISDNSNFFIYADKHLLLKTLLALLSTVFYYANNNSKITIKAEQRKNTISLLIIYSGLPLSEEEYNKMFSKNSYFSTVGQGIKMYMCKKIIDFHHGKIQFNNSENQNIFSISLPAKQKCCTNNQLEFYK